MRSNKNKRLEIRVQSLANKRLTLGPGKRGNRFVEVPPEVRVDEHTTIIPVIEAVLVGEKRHLVKEEVRDPQLMKL